MERLYRITALVKGQELDVPLELRDIPSLTYPLADQDAHAWTFEERVFRLIPVLRDWLAEQGMHSVTEEGMRRYSEQDSLTATLVRLSGGKLDGLHVVEDAVIREDRCPDCDYVARRIKDRPRLHLQLPEAMRSDLFWVDSPSRIYVASDDLCQALKEDGCTSGLSLFPVEIEGIDRSYSGLYPTSDLGWPAAPYGLTGDVCATCGRSVARSPQANDPRRYPGLPRYAFYFTFYRPDQDAHWMWTEVYGQSVLLMTDTVRDWLRHWDATMTAQGDTLRKPLNYHPLGWFPDECEQAFLDEQYH
jgi:hypothetical protein